VRQQGGRRGQHHCSRLPHLRRNDRSERGHAGNAGAQRRRARRGNTGESRRRAGTRRLRASSASLVEAVALTLRNRELVALLTVGVLTAIGFASVYIALKSEVSSGSLGYAAFFFALFLVAHFVARYTVPLADPYLLPMAALLAAIGLTEIYRL